MKWKISVSKSDLCVGFTRYYLLWCLHFQVAWLTEPLKAARRCLKPISRLGQAHQRLSPSRHSEESKDWPQLGPWWWHMWGTVTRVPIILASHWSLSRNTRFWLADISGDLIARHLTPVARDEKSQVSCSHWPLLLVWTLQKITWILLDLHFRADTLTRGW